MKKKLARMLGIILIAFIMIFTLTGCGKEKKEENTDTAKSENKNTDNTEPEKEKEEEFKLGFYEWSNPDEEQQEYIEMGMSDGTLYFEPEGSVTASIGNAIWLDGKWEYKNGTVKCYDMSMKTADYEADDPVKLEITLTYKEGELKIVNTTAPFTAHLIDFTTGELTDETKEWNPIEFAEGNTYAFIEEE